MRILAAIAPVLVLATACGAQSNASASPSPSASQVACTASGEASITWPSPDKAPATPAITAVDVSGDTLTITFAQGTPAFDVATQPHAQFAADPSGQPVDLAGSNGVKITLRGFRGDMQNYAGGRSITSAGPILLQVYELGDFEGTVTFAAGVSRSACTGVTTSGSTLSFHFVAQP